MVEQLSQSKKPLFVTFYSYKGGVGRTMALANAACVLAGTGRRVLMIDFDLEAPGLTLLVLRYLRDLGKEPPAPPRGLVDLIHDVLSNPEENALSDPQRASAYRENYTISLDIPNHTLKLEGGRLDLMPCGRLGNDYEDRLYKIDFGALYQMGIGKPLFEHFKNVIVVSGEYDYVLVDSRTGFSDEGGICTRDLADRIVLVTGLNRQNVDGTVRFLKRAQEHGGKIEGLRAVLSPIPIGFEEIQAARERELIDAVEEATDLKLRDFIRIPYHPRLALDEEPFIFRWSETPIFASYEKIAMALREMAQDRPEDITKHLLEAVLVRRQFEEALRYAAELRSQDENLATMALGVVASFLTNAMPHLPAEEAAVARMLRAEAFLALGEQAKAVEDLEAAVEFFQTRGVHTSVAEEAASMLDKLRGLSSVPPSPQSTKEE